jgi:hypothetical protein
MLATSPENRLQLVASFVRRFAKHSCHDWIPESVTIVFADEGLVVDVVVGFDLQVVAVVTFALEDGAQLLDTLASGGSFGFLVGHGWMDG